MKKVMIKNIINSLLLVVVLGVSSCNDQLADELFEKRTYLIENGRKDYQLEVDDDNTAILPVYFGINGTSLNDKDITLTLDVDPDTLERYNWEKYKNQKELYLKLLPEESYTFDASSWTIPSGELNTSAYIKISLDKIKEVGSLYNDYVLPLRINSSVGEPIGRSKYTKVLAHIAFKNDFSGQYTGKGVIKQIGTSFTTDITSTNIYAINQNTCYMFVGDKTREKTTNYLDYVVEITKDDETGTFVLTSPVESLKFKSYSSQISRKYTLNYGDDRYYIEITTVDFSYEYQDSSYNNEPVLMNFQGSFTMTKNVWKYQYPDVDVED